MSEMNDKLHDQLKIHMEHDTQTFANVSTQIAKISEGIEKIKDNHLAHIEVSIASIETDVRWLKWGIMLLVGGIVTVYFKN